MKKTRNDIINLFKTSHSEKVFNYVMSIENEIISRDEFKKIYLRLSSSRRPGQQARRAYYYLTSNKWIKED